MIYLGTVNWRYPHWVKSFYPNDDADNWLAHYSKKSSFVEVSTTSSQFPTEQIVLLAYEIKVSVF